MSSFSFDTEKFFTPDNIYYPVYSWMWNEVLTKDEIKRQLDEMYKRNIRGVCAIPYKKYGVLKGNEIYEAVISKK